MIDRLQRISHRSGVPLADSERRRPDNDPGGSIRRGRRSAPTPSSTTIPSPCSPPQPAPPSQPPSPSPSNVWNSPRLCRWISVTGTTTATYSRLLPPSATIPSTRPLVRASCPRGTSCAASFDRHPRATQRILRSDVARARSGWRGRRDRRGVRRRAKARRRDAARGRSIPRCRAFARGGVPAAPRPALWAAALGAPVTGDRRSRATFERLCAETERRRLLVDALVAGGRRDVRSSALFSLRGVHARGAAGIHSRRVRGGGTTHAPARGGAKRGWALAGLVPALRRRAVSRNGSARRAAVLPVSAPSGRVRRVSSALHAGTSGA